MMAFDGMEYKQKVWKTLVEMFITDDNLKEKFLVNIEKYFDRSLFDPSDDFNIDGFNCIKIFERNIKNWDIDSLRNLCPNAITCPFCEYSKMQPQPSCILCEICENCIYGSTIGCGPNTPVSELSKLFYII